MPSRPKISDETIEKVENWIENNEEVPITATNKAIEYLIDKALEKETEGLTEKQRQAVEKLIKKHSED